MVVWFFVLEVPLNILEGINFKLFVTALLYVDDIEYLEPIEILDKFKIRDYFQTELKF